MVKGGLQHCGFVCICYGESNLQPCSLRLRFPFYQDTEGMRKTLCGAVTPASNFSSLLVV